MAINSVIFVEVNGRILIFVHNFKMDNHLFQTVGNAAVVNADNVTYVRISIIVAIVTVLTNGKYAK